MANDIVNLVLECEKECSEKIRGARENAYARASGEKAAFEKEFSERKNAAAKEYSAKLVKAEEEAGKLLEEKLLLAEKEGEKIREKAQSFTSSDELIFSVLKNAETRSI